MPSLGYGHIIQSALREYRILSRNREQIEAKLLKLRRFIYVTVDMLPETERSVYQAEIAMLASQVGSLTDSVRETLKLGTQRNSYLTATEVRDQLKSAGFNFSQYASNPLASVNTVLRRFKPDEVETSIRDGVTAYRWIARFAEPEVVKKPRRAIRVED
jgi:hypothetical protein